MKPPKNAKEIPDFPGYYATLNGDIWNSPRKGSLTWKKLRPAWRKNGYLMVSLCKKGVQYGRSVHRLILETFVGLRPKGMECRHKDDNKKDNRFENLCWGTHSDNMKDAFQNGKRDCRGEKNSQSKLNRLQVRIIKHLLKFESLTQKEIGDIFSVSRSVVSHIKTSRNWKNL